MTLDPQVKLVLEQLAAAGGPPMETLSPEQARKAFLLPEGEREPVGKVENRTIPGPANDIPVRIYYPKEIQSNLPALVFYHGGGWVIGQKS